MVVVVGREEIQLAFFLLRNQKLTLEGAWRVQLCPSSLHGPVGPFGAVHACCLSTPVLVKEESYIYKIYKNQICILGQLSEPRCCKELCFPSTSAVASPWLSP